MKKFKIFTEEELLSLHLSVLREIGRQMGVKAPAAKNKEGLTDAITKLQRGEIEPAPLTTRGAPPKIKIDVSEFMVDEDERLKSIFNGKNEKSIGKEFEGKGVIVEGVLDQLDSGFGFVRTRGYLASKEDAYVSQPFMKKFNLRKGDYVKAVARDLRQGDAVAVQELISVNGSIPEKMLKRPYFDYLTPYYPEEVIKVESEGNFALRSIDLFAPIGKGQRGLIVAPPKTGKTTILKQLAQSIFRSNPKDKLIVLLIDERPEEVTDIRRSVGCEVIASTFDEGAEHHVKTAELVISSAKRLVEKGENVIILLDSITRLARAYNTVVESSGKVLSGGIDPVALTGPKKLFGAARNIDNGGSLTILATALIETGSRMDDVIYEEFKGTGNMEVLLSRELAEKRIFPAIDIFKSGTRREELLLTERELEAENKIRTFLSGNKNATDILIEMLRKSKDNADLIDRLDNWLKIYGK